jgi:histidine ammonia-lyase
MTPHTRPPEPEVVELHGPGLTAEQVVGVARHGTRVALAAEAAERLAAGRARVDRLAAGDEPVYGISTGFGALSLTHIAPGQRRELQRALVRSHAAGLGPPVEPEVVRAMLLLRARSLAMGYSGVRPVVVQRLVDLLDAGITPVVPEYGSLGASGDLAPLAHMSLALLGEGEVLAPGEGSGPTRPAGEALRAAGLEPLELEAKEGLALLNGTDGMLGMLLLACADAARLLATADVAAAMSVEALLGTDRVFAPELHALRPHPGQTTSAANLARLLAGSAIVASHRHHDPRVQDAYSMRCAPQVLGAARDTLDFARTVADRELAAAVDNPVILADGRVESTGNFHGAPLGYACDFLAIALTDVASLAERRIDRLLDATRSAGLPPFLAPEPGVNSGLMIAQYTAAGLLAESRQLAYPASVDSTPTSGMQEDHVSMGWTAARKLRRVAANTAAVIGIELVCAAAGLDLRAPLRPAAGTGAARAALRACVAGPGPDRVLAPDLAAAHALVDDGSVLTAVADAVGPIT